MCSSLSLLGLAQRAGYIINGEARVLKAMSNQKPILVFLASDAGDNIKKKVQDKASSFNIETITQYTSDELSRAIGKINRKVLALTDKGFIDKITR